VGHILHWHRDDQFLPHRQLGDVFVNNFLANGAAVELSDEDITGLTEQRGDSTAGAGLELD
jgi:hypothetical protein